jgi:tetratricopeptide (TPR) repeat protein
MLTAYFSDNVYPFCWAAFHALILDPTDPLALNSAVAGLFELGEIDLAGRLLDCAVLVASDFPLTWDNVAFYYDLKGDAANAIKAKEKAVGKDGGNEHPHAAWNGYHYAKSRGFTAAAAAFDRNIPSNYGLLKNDGTAGAGKPVLRVCCSCTGKFYNDVSECTNNCSATLSCFINICSPNMMCCDLDGVFSVEGGACYPPVGEQVCVEVDQNGNITLKAGVDALLMEGYAGASTNFKNKHSVFVEAKFLMTNKVKVNIYNSDPHAKRVETSFSPSKSWDKKFLKKTFGVSVGTNFAYDKILPAIICAAQK